MNPKTRSASETADYDDNVYKNLLICLVLVLKSTERLPNGLRGYRCVTKVRPTDK